jgi:signal transduction histidine kinase
MITEKANEPNRNLISGIQLQKLSKVELIEVIEELQLSDERLHTREEYEGSGLGLAICKKIIDQHGGSINVESKKDQGTSFIVNIPKNKERKI